MLSLLPLQHNSTYEKYFHTIIENKNERKKIAISIPKILPR